MSIHSRIAAIAAAMIRAQQLGGETHAQEVLDECIASYRGTLADYLACNAMRVYRAAQ
jgi:hypothetical protein